MYQIFIEKRAQKSLLRIPKGEQKRIVIAIQNLKEDQHPTGSKKLTGREAWRIRVGDYRIIYEIFEKKLIIDVIDVGHRKDIYKKR